MFELQMLLLVLIIFVFAFTVRSIRRNILKIESLIFYEEFKILEFEYNCLDQAIVEQHPRINMDIRRFISTIEGSGSLPLDSAKISLHPINIKRTVNLFNLIYYEDLKFAKNKNPEFFEIYLEFAKLVNNTLNRIKPLKYQVIKIVFASFVSIDYKIYFFAFFNIHVVNGSSEK